MFVLIIIYDDCHDDQLKKTISYDDDDDDAFECGRSKLQMGSTNTMNFIK